MFANNSQSKLPIANYKYTLKGSTTSIPLPRHNNQKPSLLHGSSKTTIMRQDIDSCSTKDNTNTLNRARLNLDHHYDEHIRKGDYLSDDSSNLSGKLYDF